MLFMSMVLTVFPGMRSYAEEAEGETAAGEESGLQDENSQRLDEVTAMDEDGSIYEIGDANGTVEEDADSEEGMDSGSSIAMFSARSMSPLVVNFNTKGNAVTNYYDETNGISGYTNGAYGADAAYLGTTGDGKIRFMLAGVTGTVDADEVELVSLDTVVDNISYYTVSGGKLVHFVSQNLNSAPASSLNNGPAPSYLSEGTKYYSYDGTYFYTDYAVMLGDYQSGSAGASAVNAGNPFRNYFQFLDMRSATSYSSAQLDSILSTAMANAWVDASSSKLTGTGSSFAVYQNTYNVNALLSMGIAVNESAWGTSWICTEKNNLFGLNAVDTAPGQSADAFTSVDECIRDFMANWMADGYLSSSDWRNHGEYLGNKGGGINVSYASDPYWGEKAAAVVWNLDAAGGSQDYLGTGPTEPDQSETVPEEPAADPSTPEEPAVDTPAAEEPSADPSTPEEPAVNTPAAEEPSADPSIPEEPAVDTPAAEEPSADPSTPEEPAVDTPAVEEPAADPSTPEEPAVDTPAADEPATDPSTSDEPTVDTPAAEEPATDPATPDEPAVNTPAEEEPAADPSTPDEPAADQPTAEATATVAEQKTVSDANTGITVSGKISSDAAVAVQVIEPNTEEYNGYVSAEPVKGRTVLGVYDIELTGTMEGEVQLTFPVGTEYNGRDVIVLHYSDDGTYETINGKVENGQVTILTDGFSTYVVALNDAGSNTDTKGAPQTGDDMQVAVWAALLAFSAVAGAASLGMMRRRTGR